MIPGKIAFQYIVDWLDNLIKNKVNKLTKAKTEIFGLL